MGHGRPKRRFTLLDAMVLLAATAVGLAVVVRDAETDLGDNVLARVGDSIGHYRAVIPVSPETVGWDAESVAIQIPRGLMLMPPMLAAWSMGLLGLRFVSPRPRRRRMAVEAGVLACLAGAMAVGIVTAWRLVWFLTEVLYGEGWGYPWAYSWLYQAPAGSTRLVAFSVLVAWTALAWGGLWRRSRDWIERSGRVIGGLWIAAYLGDTVNEYIYYMWPIFFKGGFR